MLLGTRVNFNITKGTIPVVYPGASFLISKGSFFSEQLNYLPIRFFQFLFQFGITFFQFRYDGLVVLGLF